ncbi:conserved hypothetical protein [Sphingomonas sp. EC-HK361]|uniref:pyridoxamine 5'-phosphate oxidase family protein n=1 Tax=Sphingomonas sp. EC-HK361 TaxID=2038397 RepID=UPI001254A4C8|nr:pyridoxamine 5'-phosphate oxidase family protein [Sphingomonas sp. EC-HK361]VVT23699.1 conserved hypothetical protein [Sphingomonas sp. EC-HK361]
MADQDIAETFLSKLKSSPFVMVGLTGTGEHSEPLTAQIDDTKPNALFFFVGRDNRAIGGGDAMVQFAAKGHDFFACLHGQISQDNDRAQIDTLWNRQVEAWFPGGKDDPNLALLRFDVDSAELWETDMSLSGKVKMLFGGKIEGDEEGNHAVVGSLG